MLLLKIGTNQNGIPKVKHFTGENYTLTNNLDIDISAIIKTNSNLIVIQAELSTPYLENQLFGGIELLVWLRIKGITSHIVITSFYPVQTILKKTKLGIIIGSKGVSFHQVPIYTASDYWKNLVNDKSDESDLKSYLSSIFDIAHFRHVYANVWGLKRLVDVFNEINIEQFSLKKYSNKSQSSLNYNIATYYYEKKNERLSFPEKRMLEQYSVKLKNIYGINIIYIDDKANTGYTAFLLRLFNSSCKIFTIEIDKNDNERTLYNKFEQIWSLNKGNIDFVISDLRLFEHEEQCTNYKDFVSIKLMRMIFDLRDGKRRLKFQKLKYLLFTASNQFFNFKNAFEKNKYTPSDIFVKEGFDNSVIPNHKYKNYEHLLTSLIDLSKVKFRNKLLALGKNDEQFNLIKDDFLNNFIFDIWKKEYDKIAKTLNKYEFIILDTNIFLLCKPYLPIYCNKVVISYPVYEELKRIERSENADENFIFEYANWFTENYSGFVVKDCLSARSIEEIDTLLESGNKDVADEYFVEILKFFRNVLDGNEKILFLSNDKTNKGTNISNMSPVSLVQEWITENNISNVDVASHFDDTLIILNSYDNHDKQNFSEKTTERPLITNNNLEHSKKQIIQSPQIKFSDCELQANGYDLKAKLNNQIITVRIGSKFRNKFKSNFEKFKKTHDNITLIFNPNDNFYYIQNISEVINTCI
jgi:hypothetical protein